MVIIIMLSIKHQSVGGNNNAGQIKMIYDSKSYSSRKCKLNFQKAPRFFKWQHQNPAPTHHPAILPNAEISICFPP